VIIDGTVDARPNNGARNGTAACSVVNGCRAGAVHAVDDVAELDITQANEISGAFAGRYGQPDV